MILIEEFCNKSLFLNRKLKLLLKVHVIQIRFAAQAGIAGLDPSITATNICGVVEGIYSAQTLYGFKKIAFIFLGFSISLWIPR